MSLLLLKSDLKQCGKFHHNVLSIPGLFGEMEGGLCKEGVWGYYGLLKNGEWTEECGVVPEVCEKLKEAGLGTASQVGLKL